MADALEMATPARRRLARKYQNGPCEMVTLPLYSTAFLKGDLEATFPTVGIPTVAVYKFYKQKIQWFTYGENDSIRNVDGQSTREATLDDTNLKDDRTVPASRDMAIEALSLSNIGLR